MTKPHRSKHHHSKHKQHQNHHDSGEVPAVVVPANREVVGQWSAYAPYNSGLFYYRARRIPYELVGGVVNDSRNRVVFDGQGGYWHYEFIATRDLPHGYFSHAMPNIYQAAPQAPAMSAPDFAYGAAQPPQQQSQQLLLQPPEVYEDDDDTSGFSMNSGSANSKHNPTIIDVDRTEDGLKITFPSASDDHVIYCDKNSKKRPGSDQRSRASHKNNVDKWLER